MTEEPSARARLESLLRLILDSDEYARGIFLIDASAEGGGFPLYTLVKQEVKEENIGPSTESSEAVGGILLESWEMLKKLASLEYLNLGNLERVVIEGKKAVAIIKAFREASIVFLLFGRKEMKIGFVVTLLERIWPELEKLSKEAFG